MLQNQGGHILFTLVLDLKNLEKPGFLKNGPDSIPFSRLEYRGDSAYLYFDPLDSFIAADKNFTSGHWEKRASGNRRHSLPFKTMPLPLNPQEPPVSRFDGEWNVIFQEPSGPSPATGVFQFSDGLLRGTFLTETGDYRFLEGIADENGFKLWTFDIAHAYVFRAEVTTDSTLSGQFYAYNEPPVPWTAVRGKNALRDPMTTTKLIPGKSVSFSFPDLSGKTVSHSDPQFAGKPMLVYLFGSWCPNCADESKLLKELSLTYENTELQFVGLAFEYSGDPAEDLEMVKRYRQRLGVTWTTLLAGISDKTDASVKIPFVEKVVSFPTSFFVRRDGSIAAVHTGFSGPGTGAYYHLERQRFITHLEEILRP